jgi:kynureninase
VTIIDGTDRMIDPSFVLCLTEFMAQDDLYKPLSTDFLVPNNRDIGAIALDNGGKNLKLRVRHFLSKRSTQGDEKCTYLCGNSLGLLSKTSDSEVQNELNVWGTR